MTKQKVLSLSVRPFPGETSRNFQFREHHLREVITETGPRHAEPEKLFSDLLKRHAREAMAGVTECPPVALPHALARLRDIKGIIRAALAAEIVPGMEGLRSDGPLTHAHTLADILECLTLTEKEHRAPVFLNSRDTELAKLNEKIDLLASLVSMALPVNFPMPQAFCREESEVKS
jgi:hypothetical protein